jgi:hypothetical protein
MLEGLFTSLPAVRRLEIMYETGLSLHPTQRELENLIGLRIIKKRETRDRVYYEKTPIRLFSNHSVNSTNQPKKAISKPR